MYSFNSTYARLEKRETIKRVTIKMLSVKVSHKSFLTLYLRDFRQVEIGWEDLWISLLTCLLNIRSWTMIKTRYLTQMLKVKGILFYVNFKNLTNLSCLLQFLKIIAWVFDAIKYQRMIHGNPNMLFPLVLIHHLT